MRLLGGFELPDTVSFYAGNMLSALFVFVAPEVKCVTENYVAKQIVLWTIIDIKRGIELEVWCDVAGETDG